MQLTFLTGLMQQKGDTMAGRAAAQFNTVRARRRDFAGPAGLAAQECPASLAVCHKCRGAEHEWDWASMGDGGTAGCCMFQDGQGGSTKSRK